VKSIDVSNTAHILTFRRFEDEETVKEQLLFCKPLLGCTTSNVILKNRPLYEGSWHRMEKNCQSLLL
jgi:hypothetical protein